MIEWLQSNAVWIAIVSAIVMVASATAGLALLVHMPADHFVHPDPPRHLILIVARNVLGIVLLLIGLVMSVPLVPGPGIIMLIAGLSLTNFPGKRRMELWILRRRWVHAPINRLRRWFVKPPLTVPAS